MRGNHRATCHIDNRRCFCTEGEGAAAAGLWGRARGTRNLRRRSLFIIRVAHMQLARDADTRVTNRIF